jgi:hypothetical protein
MYLRRYSTVFKLDQECVYMYERVYCIMYNIMYDVLHMYCIVYSV